MVKIIIKLQGGLGNQMFQYSFGQSLKNNYEVFYDNISGFKPIKNITKRAYQLDLFDLKINLISPIQSKIYSLNNRYIKKILTYLGVKFPISYKEKNPDFDPNISLLKRSEYYFDGYWQSEKYFREYKSDISESFNLKKSFITNELNKTIEEISDPLNNSVVIQIRRGDYFSNKKTSALHGILNEKYYLKAVNNLKQSLIKPSFYIISDDVKWSEDNVGKFCNAKILDVKDYEQMEIMKSCKHLIISNSSFGWWGAWLNKNLNKIFIVPDKWFNGINYNIDDRIPKDWVKISND